jgi:hypothetical protein
LTFVLGILPFRVKEYFFNIEAFMNLHIYDVNQIQRILKLAFRCKQHVDPTKLKLLDLDASIKLKNIVDEYSKLDLDEKGENEAIEFIKNHNNSTSSTERRIGIPELTYLCCTVIQNGNLLERTNIKVHAAWTLFLNALNTGEFQKKYPGIPVWMTFMKTLTQLGFNENVKCIHNYIFVMHVLSQLDDKEGRTKKHFITLMVPALLHGLELSDQLDVNVVENLAEQLLNCDIFHSLYSRSQQHYLKFSVNEKEFKSACDDSEKKLLQVLWCSPQIHSSLQLVKPSNDNVVLKPLVLQHPINLSALKEAEQSSDDLVSVEDDFDDLNLDNLHIDDLQKKLSQFTQSDPFELAMREKNDSFDSSSSSSYTPRREVELQQRLESSLPMNESDSQSPRTEQSILSKSNASISSSNSGF